MDFLRKGLDEDADAGYVGDEGDAGEEDIGFGEDEDMLKDA